MPTIPRRYTTVVVAGIVLGLLAMGPTGGSDAAHAAGPDGSPPPATGVSAPAGTPVVPSPHAVVSAAPVAVLPVDWVTVDDDQVFRGSGHSGSDRLSDVALAPSGEAVIVGWDGLYGLTWSKASGGDWQKNTLPNPFGAQPRRVLAAKEGFVAIGRRFPAGDDERSDPVGFIWTSRDGIDWSRVTVEGAIFDDLDSVDDTVAILGTLRETPTVWTSRSGNPWEAATIAEGISGFSPDQLAVSADGVYLVRDKETGLAQRSEDGLRFTSVGLPDGLQAGDVGRYINALVRVADGFALVVGPTRGQYEDLGVSTWLSSDGPEWRLGDAAPGLALGAQLGIQQAAAQMFGDRADLHSALPPTSTHLSFLQADGTWCAVSPPAVEGVFSSGTMAWNEDGTLVIAGPLERHGGPVVWHATGVRCGR